MIDFENLSEKEQAERNRQFEERSKQILDLIHMGASSDLLHVELANMITDGLGLERQSPAEVLKFMKGDFQKAQEAAEQLTRQILDGSGEGETTKPMTPTPPRRRLKNR